MTQDRVMLLIDADNVSVDVIEQAVAHLLARPWRRCTCAAPTAPPRARLKHQAVFRRLQIKPMVNLSTGKNSTDIALAVDAVDLVLAERPDVVAIASSDSDFAPLVGRLREKGCRVVGIGQEGKTGDETQLVYDEFTVMAHRKTRATAAAPRPARKTASRGTAKTAARPSARATAKAAADELAAAPAETPARKTATRRRAAASAAPAPAPVAPPVPEKVQQMLAQLPELSRGGTLELRVASVRLREAGLLTRSGSSTKLFGQFADRFELLPPGNPNHVRLRAARAGA